MKDEALTPGTMEPSPSRHFFDVQPATWQDLEAMVRQGFEEMAYEAHRNHEVETVRGRVKIDVFAVKRTTPIPTVVLCECKHWTKPVDQSVVHSFRSVCSDVGAHFGLIVSKVGFQSGAEETRGATNIHLLNFSEFQETFFGEWKSGIFLRFAQMSDSLLPLMPMNPDFAGDHALQSKLAGVRIFKKYEMFFGERSYTSYFIHEGLYPVRMTDPRGDPRDMREISLASPRQFFEVGLQACRDARTHFGI